MADHREETENPAQGRFTQADPGPTSPGVNQQPRGNQDTEHDDVDKGVDKLERIVSW